MLVLLFCFLIVTGGSHGAGFSDEDKQYILDMHNTQRSKTAKGEGCAGQPQPQSCNMQALVWCDELTEKAQKHASDCSGPSHDLRSGRKTANFDDVGQNMMDCLKGSKTCPKEANDGFLEECNGYTYSSNTCNPEKAGRAGVCGHYTAYVWADTRCIAAGYDECASGSHLNSRMVVNYAPGGNIAGEKPYKEGPPCSCCNEGQLCLDGLCIDKAVCEQDGLQCTEAHSQCIDKMDSCSAYAAAGYCTGAYESYMSSNCPKSCNKCSPRVVQRNKQLKVHAKLQVKKETCLKSTGSHYAGDVDKTSSGKQCQAWASNSPHSVSVYDFEFVDGSKSSAGNKCRNPGGASSKPWCYTTDSTVRWEYCDIPAC